MIVNRAVVAAKTAFLSWSELGYHRRAEYLKKVANILEERIDEFSLAESKDQGKPVNLARNMDMPRYKT